MRNKKKMSKRITTGKWKKDSNRIKPTESGEGITTKLKMLVVDNRFLNTFSPKSAKWTLDRKYQYYEDTNLKHVIYCHPRYTMGFPHYEHHILVLNCRAPMETDGSDFAGSKGGWTENSFSAWLSNFKTELSVGNIVILITSKKVKQSFSWGEKTNYDFFYPISRALKQVDEEGTFPIFIRNEGIETLRQDCKAIVQPYISPQVAAYRHMESDARDPEYIEAANHRCDFEPLLKEQKTGRFIAGAIRIGGGFVLILPESNAPFNTQIQVLYELAKLYYSRRVEAPRDSEPLIMSGEGGPHGLPAEHPTVYTDTYTAGKEIVNFETYRASKEKCGLYLEESLYRGSKSELTLYIKGQNVPFKDNREAKLLKVLIRDHNQQNRLTKSNAPKASLSATRLEPTVSDLRTALGESGKLLIRGSKKEGFYFDKEQRFCYLIVPEDYNK